MDVLLPLLVCAAFGVPVVYQILVSMGALELAAGARARFWRQAARAVGLERVVEARSSLAGWAEALHVRLSRYEEGQLSGTRIAISGRGLPADVTVRPEGFGGSSRGSGVREIEVGDEAFDRAAWVEGPPALVRSLLHADNRATIRGLFEGRLDRKRLSPFWATGRFDDGVLRVDVLEEAPPTGGGRSESGIEAGMWGAEPAVKGDYVGGRDRLPEVLQAVLGLARRLETPEDVPRRLAENMKTETVAGVRSQILTTLARELASHPATREALLAAREDPDAEVRLRAGIALGPEGREVLLRVASGEGAEDVTTERAVLALGVSLTTEEAQDVLRNALRTRREATARACLRVLGQRRAATVMATLAKVVAVEKPELAAVAAEALGTTGDPIAQKPLLAALGSPHASVRVAAARALGQVGTIAAVQPLKEREARDRAVRAAARQAIAEIQSRASGAAPGQLSLAGGLSGQLSLASGERGRLSLASGEEGRASSPRHPEEPRPSQGDERPATPADSSGPVEPESLGMTGSRRVGEGE